MIEKLQLYIDLVLPLILFLRCLYFTFYILIMKKNPNIVLFFSNVPRPFYCANNNKEELKDELDDLPIILMLIGILLLLFDEIFFIVLNPIAKLSYFISKQLNKIIKYNK